MSFAGADLSIYKTNQSFIIGLENFWGPYQGVMGGNHIFYSLNRNDLFAIINDLSYIYIDESGTLNSSIGSVCTDLTGKEISCEEIYKTHNLLPKVIEIPGNRPNLELYWIGY